MPDLICTSSLSHHGHTDTQMHGCSPKIAQFHQYWPVSQARGVKNYYNSLADSILESFWRKDKVMKHRDQSREAWFKLLVLRC